VAHSNEWDLAIGNEPANLTGRDPKGQSDCLNVNQRRQLFWLLPR
jgi:hypothetical protein